MLSDVGKEGVGGQAKVLFSDLIVISAPNFNERKKKKKKKKLDVCVLALFKTIGTSFNKEKKKKIIC